MLLDTSKQRTHLRKKITSERTLLKALIDKYNVLIEHDGGVPLTVDGVLTGDLPHESDQSDGKRSVQSTKLFNSHQAL